MSSRYLRSQATLAVILAIVLVMIVISALISTITINNYLNINSSMEATKALLLADSAMEEALLALHKDSDYTSNTYSVPEGTASIVIADIGGNQRTVTTTTTSGVYRQISATIQLTGAVHPFQEIAAFAGDDVDLIKSNAMLVGNLWSNDNVNLDYSTVVQGNVYAAGSGNNSFSSVDHGARVEDNPNTPEIEGNFSSIDRIRVLNSGYVQGTATSTLNVQTGSGGTVGAAVVDPTLVIDTIEVPTFEFSTFKTEAQAAGKYYATKAAFLSHLTLQGNNISGTYYIADTSTLTLPTGNTYTINGTIVTEGGLEIQATSYTHTADEGKPAIVAKKPVLFTDKSPCNCVATVVGIIYSEQNIQLKHDQYTGSQAHAVDITGALWAGDDATIEDYSKLTFDVDMVAAVLGFNFTGEVGADNIVEVMSWSIN